MMNSVVTNTNAYEGIDLVKRLRAEVERLRARVAELEGMCHGCETVGRAACPIHFDADGKKL